MHATHHASCVTHPQIRILLQSRCSFTVCERLRNGLAYHGVMGHFISRWFIMSVAVAVTVLLLPGLQVVGHPPVLGIVAFALFMALINASIKPLTHMIALPFSVLSFGIVALVINWLFMRLASWLAISLFDVGVTVNGFWWSVLASLIISIVTGIVSAIIGD